jgi:hypothetical protein
VYDTSGNVSSGAVALAFASRPEGSSGGDTSVTPVRSGGGVAILDNIITIPIVTAEATSSVVAERVTVDMKMPKATDISIKQGGQLFTLQENTIKLDPEKSFVISVPYQSVAGNLKSIIATVLDPTDNKSAYSYLLKINKNQTAYEAVIAAINVFGNSQIRLAIYDYEAFVVAEYQAPVVFDGVTVEAVSTDDVARIRYWYLILGVASFSFLWLLIILLRRLFRD